MPKANKVSTYARTTIGNGNAGGLGKAKMKEEKRRRKKVYVEEVIVRWVLEKLELRGRTVSRGEK